MAALEARLETKKQPDEPNLVLVTNDNLHDFEALQRKLNEEALIIQALQEEYARRGSLGRESVVLSLVSARNRITSVPIDELTSRAVSTMAIEFIIRVNQDRLQAYTSDVIHIDEAYKQLPEDQRLSDDVITLLGAQALERPTEQVSLPPPEVYIG